MAANTAVSEQLNDSAIELAKKAQSADNSVEALRYAYAAAALFGASIGKPFVGSYSHS
jgi:hypothetical protein